jgi:YVTN family beta-propeller protein
VDFSPRPPLGKTGSVSGKNRNPARRQRCTDDVDGQRGRQVSFEVSTVSSIRRTPSWSIPATRAAGALLAAIALAGAALAPIRPASALSTPSAYAATASKAYVGLFKENAVAVLDTTTDTILSKIPVPAGPHGIVATPDGGKVYVTSDGASTVSVIDTATDAVTRSVEVGKAPHGITLTPDGSLALVGVWGGNEVAFLDTRTDQVVRQTAVGSPHNIAVTPDGAFAYIGSQAQDAPALVKLNVATGEAVGRVPLDGAPRGLAVTPDGTAVYTTRAGQDDVLVTDASSGQPVTRIAVGPSPHLPSFTSNGLALVNVQGPGLIATIDPVSHTVLGTAKVGTQPHWQAVTDDGKTALETNEGSNDVSIVDLATRAVVATISVGEGPRKIVLLPGASVATANPGAGTTSAPQNASASSPANAAPSTGDVEVRIDKFIFGPPIAITAGQTISWLNADSVAHTVTADDDSWDSEDLAPGQRFSKTIDAPGEYAYYCEIHPHMHGTVIVR